jgi:hypothetical protein
LTANPPIHKRNHQLVKISQPLDSLGERKEKIKQEEIENRTDNMFSFKTAIFLISHLHMKSEE